MKTKEHYVEEVSARYKAGESTREIAASYDVNYQTIINLLRASGVEIRPRGGNNAEKCKGQKRYFIAGKKKQWEK